MYVVVGHGWRERKRLGERLGRLYVIKHFKGVRAGEAGTPGRGGGSAERPDKKKDDLFCFGRGWVCGAMGWGVGWFKTEISFTKHHREVFHRVRGWFPEKGL
ncbi:hypothetical protein R3P38DRAFT_2772512 [Favolaschia claudopus]|uniref:Uncharacterized protein n=1 Tax=Favolaschia claudopus TaxID=2862362 RepID=A0AAW0C848_9AGAR